MADPTTPAATAPAAQPKVKTELEQRYDEAGYARNRAELGYKTAVKEHGKDSAEAKAAQETLTKAQAEVEAIQKELTGGKKVVSKPAPKAPAKIEEKAVVLKRFEPLKFQERFSTYEYIEKRPKAAYLYEVRSEMLIRRDFSKVLNSKRLKPLLDCIEKNKADGQKTNFEPCLKLLEDAPSKKVPKTPNGDQLKLLQKS